MLNLEGVYCVENEVCSIDNAKCITKEQGRTSCGKTRRDKTRQDRIRQDKTRKKKTRQSRTEQDKVGGHKRE